MTKNVNFIYTPSDQCLCNQGIGDTKHLAITVIAILQKYGFTHLGNQSYQYLYGHHTISLADN